MNQTYAFKKHLVSPLLALFAMGCFGDICEEAFDGHCPDVAAGGAGAGGAGLGGSGAGPVGGNGGAGMGGNGGAGGGLLPGCTPMEGQAIGAECGVFVQFGASGNGTQASPLGSIATAAAGLSAGSAIYVCGPGTFPGSVALAGGVSLFGGLDCNSWTYSSGNATPVLEGAPDLPALTVNGAGTSHVWSIDITAVNAMTAGTSSIALLVTDATLDLDDAVLTSQAGAAGAAPPAQPGQASAAPGGSMGANAGSTPANAMAGSHMCGNTPLAGGFGGKGGDSTQAIKDGGNGTAGDMGNGGAAGIGQTGASLNCVAGQGLGGGGMSGNNGLSGGGATAFGTLTAMGFEPADGLAGTAGDMGQSGGGGGGSKATASTHGAGGGGGGAGGCGGSGGVAGKGGGSSIALASFNATVTMTASVTLKPGVGGKGGDGGQGQFGQFGGGAGTGGMGGGGVLPACAGGSGGTGGTGGNGGGGRGGHAIAIAYSGAAPQGGTPDISAAMGGAGGVGGNNGVTPAGSVGGDGQVVASQEL